MGRRRVTIIYNPASGRWGRRAADVDRMTGLLAARGLSVASAATRGPNDATRIAAQAVAEGTDLVISYGGDGTLNEVLQAVVGSRTALGVWPGGTANVVARELGMLRGIEQVAEIISAGKTKRVAVGLATIERPPAPITQEPGAASGPSRRYFLMFAGIGLDASIARNVNKRLKRRTGEFAYWVEGLKHIATWERDAFTIQVDGNAYESTFALIGNGKGYGGGLCMTPEARLEEPWFQVYILPKHGNNFAYLRDLALCVTGKLDRASGATVRAAHVAANSSCNPWVEVDGEIIGQLPMTFDVVPDTLSLLVP